MLAGTKVRLMIKFLLKAAVMSTCGKPADKYSPVVALETSISMSAIWIFSLFFRAIFIHSLQGQVDYRIGILLGQRDICQRKKKKYGS
jgi:hypothetical protein